VQEREQQQHNPHSSSRGTYTCKVRYCTKDASRVNQVTSAVERPYMEESMLLKMLKSSLEYATRIKNKGAQRFLIVLANLAIWVRVGCC
jgi:hypothetical protein